MLPSSTFDYAQALLKIQRTLMDEFRSAFPLVRDWKLLLDFPNLGDIVVNGSRWSFRRHGLGIEFVSPEGVTVDIHREITRTELIDAWRLLQFINSQSNVDIGNAHERIVEAELQALVRSGHLRAADIPGTYSGA